MLLCIAPLPVPLNHVLMLGEQDETRIGRPLVPDARVIAAVEVPLPVSCVQHSSLERSQLWGTVDRSHT